MKKQIAFVLALILAFSLCMTACSGAVSTPAAAPEAAPEAGGAEGTIVVKYATTFPAVGTQADGVNYLSKCIAENTDGRLAVEFYPASSLGDKVASMEGLRGGTIEMTSTAATDLSSYSSIWSVFSLPYLWESGDQAVAVLSDSAVAEVLNADAAENGFVIIGWANAGSRSVLNTKRAIYAPEDLNGLRIRCMEDPILAGSINAMGASATPLAWSECYTALQQGTIDGIENNMPTILDNGMTEVAKYFSLTEHFIIPDPIFVSKVWFDGLSTEDQEAVLKAGQQFTTEYAETIWPAAEAAAVGRMEEAGVQINEVDKTVFVEATKTVIDDFLKSADADQVALYELLMKTRENY